MVCPAVLAWIEQRHVLLIEVSGNVGALVGIASFAAQGEILGCGRTTVFFGNDVINLKWQQRHICWILAILATMLGALPDKLLQRDFHAALTTRVQHA